MRDDLLDAQACIDWAVAQLPALSERINSWLNLNFEVMVKNHDSSCPNDVVIAIQKEALPITFNIEAGCILNTVRSSLDYLAVALAKRHGMSEPDKAYFPFAKTVEEFRTRKFRGGKFIEALSQDEQRIIESFKPYCGGNKLLWALHQLDITRKHRRLLTVSTSPGSVQIIGWGLGKHFTPIATGFMSVTDEETVIGLMAKGAPQYDMKAMGIVTLNEAIIGVRTPIIPALRDFAGLANSIVNKFDDP